MTRNRQRSVSFQWGLVLGCWFWLPLAGWASTRVPTGGLPLPAQWHEDGGLFLVEAKVDGKGPFKLVLDTGASLTALDVSKREQWRTNDESAVVLSDAADGRLRVEIIKVPQVKIGPWESGPTMVAFVDFSMLRNALGENVDGVAGILLFTNIQLTIDYPAQKVVLQPGDAPRPPDANELPFEWRLGIPSAPVQAGSETFRAVVDSGYDGGFSLPSSPKTEFEEKLKTVQWSATAAGKHEDKAGRLKLDIVWGGLCFARPITPIANTDDGLIGSQVLRHFRMTLVAPERKLWLEPGTNGPVITPPLSSHGLALSPQNDYLMVEGVVPGTAAARSKIRVGDEITRINGEPATAWPRKRRNDFEGPLELELRRNKKTWHEKLEKTVLVP